MWGHFDAGPVRAALTGPAYMSVRAFAGTALHCRLGKEVSVTCMYLLIYANILNKFKTNVKWQVSVACHNRQLNFF